MKLLNTQKLEQSDIVANCLMNRERGLEGVNSYAKELNFSIFEYLLRKSENQPSVHWIDLCCGKAKALIQAAKKLEENKISNIHLEGIDLVGMFDRHPHSPYLNLTVQSLFDWQPAIQYDLITCIHGLHYVGDKLQILQTCLQFLSPDGLFFANMDLENLKTKDGLSLRPTLLSLFKKHQITYHSKRKILYAKEKTNFIYTLKYLGANAHAGPNYTGQNAVDSYYDFL